MNEAIILAPCGEVSPTAYVGRYLQTQKRFTLRQGTALKRLLAGLQESDSRLENGRRVADRHDAVTWLLEQLANEMNLPSSPATL